MPSSKPSSNLADVQFIAARLRHFAEIGTEGLRAHLEKHRLDGLFTVPHPDRGSIIIGREAAQRFTDLAKRYLETQPQKRARANLSEFIDKLRFEFTRRFLKERSPIDQSNADRLVSTAYKAAARDFEAATHFIPCTLFQGGDVQAFPVGPVTFTHKHAFLAGFGAEFEALRGKIAERNMAHTRELLSKGYTSLKVDSEHAAQVGQQMVDGMLAWYGEFNWVASVAIPECEEDVSYQRAVLLIRAALNIIKLILGAKHTDRLRTAEDHGHAPKAAKLRQVGGEFYISLSIKPKDNVGGDNWLEMLHERSNGFFARLCEVLNLSAGLDGGPPLCARFLDALHWYGDAVAEISLAARVVKFVTAIERVVGTGSERNEDGSDRGVTEIVMLRAGILYSEASEIPFEEGRKAINVIYKARSDLVHGSQSPFAESVAADAYKAQEVTRMILLAAVGLFQSLGLANPDFKETELRRVYHILERPYRDKPRSPRA